MDAFIDPDIDGTTEADDKDSPEDYGDFLEAGFIEIDAGKFLGFFFIL